MAVNRTVLALIFTVFVGLPGSYYITKIYAHSGRPDREIAAVADATQPLIGALEKYHSEKGVYPTFLDQLGGDFRSSKWWADGVLYTTARFNWIIKDDNPCAERKKANQGWIMKKTRAAGAEELSFMRDCVTGYRSYTLQSKDFDRENVNMERWASYDSDHKQWQLRWCRGGVRQPQQGKGIQILASNNGMCHSREAITPRFSNRD